MIGRCLPTVVGLTGGLASGKSSVSRIWKEAGAYVIDADSEARAVLKKGTIGLWLVRRKFGARVIVPESGELDRAALAGIVFSDSEARKALNARTHPLIIGRMVARLFDAIFVRYKHVVVLDTPLLFETRALMPFVSTTVCVYAPEKLMLRRAVERGMDPDDAAKRVRSQMNIERKKELAKHIIDNSNDPIHLKRNALEILDRVQPGTGILGFRTLVSVGHFVWIRALTKKVFDI